MGHRLKFGEVEVEVSGYSVGEAKVELQGEAEVAHLVEVEGQASLKDGQDDESSSCHVPYQAPWPRSYLLPLITHDIPEEKKYIVS